ncbi:hypothetical protein EDB87DRAFT_1578930 [Lactarius vividus]|nr:hypothetical protein EDB87DRAFT_1578930 [Lactarius vividus]
MRIRAGPASETAVSRYARGARWDLKAVQPHLDIGGVPSSDIDSCQQTQDEPVRACDLVGATYDARVESPGSSRSPLTPLERMTGLRGTSATKTSVELITKESDPRFFAHNQCSIACASTAYATDDSQEARLHHSKLTPKGQLLSLSCACELLGGGEERSPWGLFGLCSQPMPSCIPGALVCCVLRGASLAPDRGDGGRGQADIQGERMHLSTVPQPLRRPRQRPVQRDPFLQNGSRSMEDKKENQHGCLLAPRHRTSSFRSFESVRESTVERTCRSGKEGFLEQRSSHNSSSGNHMVDMLKEKRDPSRAELTGLELSYDSSGVRHARRSEPGGGQPWSPIPGPDSYWSNGDWPAVQGPRLPRASR